VLERIATEVIDPLMAKPFSAAEQASIKPYIAEIAERIGDRKTFKSFEELHDLRRALDKKLDPKNTDKDEAILWVSTFGKGRVCNNALGHDVPAMSEPGFKTLLIRGVEWCATGEAKTPVPAELQKSTPSAK
jgi:hypothetical protein